MRTVNQQNPLEVCELLQAIIDYYPLNTTGSDNDAFLDFMRLCLVNRTFQIAVHISLYHRVQRYLRKSYDYRIEHGWLLNQITLIKQSRPPPELEVKNLHIALTTFNMQYPQPPLGLMGIIDFKRTLSTHFGRKKRKIINYQEALAGNLFQPEEARTIATSFLERNKEGLKQSLLNLDVFQRRIQQARHPESGAVEYENIELLADLLPRLMTFDAYIRGQLASQENILMPPLINRDITFTQKLAYRHNNIMAGCLLILFDLTVIYSAHQLITNQNYLLPISMALGLLNLFSFAICFPPAGLCLADIPPLSSLTRYFATRHRHSLFNIKKEKVGHIEPLREICIEGPNGQHTKIKLV